ncbi:MAG: hypothetical protein ACLT98_13425 [Eggerthellaceae bacterium]
MGGQSEQYDQVGPYMKYRTARFRDRRRNAVVEREWCRRPTAGISAEPTAAAAARWAM